MKPWELVGFTHPTIRLQPFRDRLLAGPGMSEKLEIRESSGRGFLHANRFDTVPRLTPIMRAWIIWRAVVHPPRRPFP